MDQLSKPGKHESVNWESSEICSSTAKCSYAKFKNKKPKTLRQKLKF